MPSCYYYDEQRNRCNCYVNENLNELLAENAKLVDVLHEVETEAVYAYNCLQQDCMTTASSSEHFFKKWWHAECKLDRVKDENDRLRELVDYMAPIAWYAASECERDRMRELGVDA